MSRSYKKNLALTHSSERGSVKKDKRIANKKVRQFLKDVNNEIENANYKKVSPSWLIRDYLGDNFIEWEDFWLLMVERAQKMNKPIPDKKVMYRKWYQWYKAK